MGEENVEMSKSRNVEMSPYNFNLFMFRSRRTASDVSSIRCFNVSTFILS